MGESNLIAMDEMAIALFLGLGIGAIGTLISLPLVMRGQALTQISQHIRNAAAILVAWCAAVFILRLLSLLMPALITDQVANYLSALMLFSLGGIILGSQLRRPNAPQQSSLIDREELSQTAATVDHDRIATALRESEERFRRVFEDSPIGIYRALPDGLVVMANPAALKMVGCKSSDEFVQRTPEVLETATGSSDEPIRSEFSWQLPDGRMISIRENVRKVRDQTGKILYYEGTLEDVTDRWQAEEHLRASESLFRNIIATIPCGVFWKDRDSVYLGCNDQFAQNQGFKSSADVVGLRDHDLPFGPLASQDFLASDQQVIESGLPILNLEETQLRPDGKVTLLISKVPLRNHLGTVIGVLGTYLDLSEQKKLEEQFLQAQKMDAVGRLAGGIAHDFNNLLTVISGNADLIDRQLPGTLELSDRLNDLRDAASRAAGLVRQLLTFSRRHASRLEVINLNDVVAQLTGMLRRILEEKIKIVLDLSKEGVQIRADRVQLEQVVMNLVINARDAMPNGGTLSLRTERRTLGMGAGLEPRFDACLIVSDTGCGMSEEVKARIFEPFFTTKGPDLGTGLGLATVHGIVHQAGGNISVDSTLGVGTAITVEFPAISGAAIACSETPRPSAIFSRPMARGRHVLLVEDEDAVRTLARITFECQGYSVTAASDAEAALAQLETGQPLDLLVTDLTMPGMNGQELVEIVRADRPNLCVIFMSGYVPESDQLERLHKAIFLPKPFSPSQLLEAAHRLLREDSSAREALAKV